MKAQVTRLFVRLPDFLQPTKTKKYTVSNDEIRNEPKPKGTAVGSTVTHTRTHARVTWRYSPGELGMSSFIKFLPVFCVCLFFFQYFVSKSFGLSSFCFVFVLIPVMLLFRFCFNSGKEDPKDIRPESLVCPLL